MCKRQFKEDLYMKVHNHSKSGNIQNACKYIREKWPVYRIEYYLPIKRIEILIHYDVDELLKHYSE